MICRLFVLFGGTPFRLTKYFVLYSFIDYETKSTTTINKKQSFQKQKIKFLNSYSYLHGQQIATKNIKIFQKSFLNCLDLSYLNWKKEQNSRDCKKDS